MSVPDSLPLYDHARLYDCLRMPSDDLAFYGGLAARTAGPVLELACGTGRISLGLAGQGIRVTALDRAEAMIGLAREKALALPEAARPGFVVGDMTSFSLPGRFDLAVIAFNSLQHLYSNERILACLARIRAHLTPDGWLTFDVMNPDVRLLGQTEAEPYRIDRLIHPLSGLAVDVYEHLLYDRARQVCRITLTFESEGEPAITVVQHLRMLFPLELDFLLQQAGWEMVARYGSFAPSAFDGQSPKQIIVCRPQA